MSRAPVETAAARRHLMIRNVTRWLDDDTIGEIADEVMRLEDAARQEVRERIAAAIDGLVLDPAAASTPHCVEEYNGGLRNAAELARTTP